MEVKITAQDVNKLRQTTGAGMMDCKKALEEANGDMEGAIEILRKKGQKLSLKRADRDATEGAVIALATADRSRGVVLKLSCETDFVAKNENFVEVARKIAQIALDNHAKTVDELSDLMYDNELTVGNKVIEQVGVIGEKIEVSKFDTLEAACVTAYIHAGNRLGVLVGFNKAGDNIVEAGKDVAMQIAAMNPVSLNKEDVDPAIIAKELEIGMEIARNEGKPEAMLEKISQGRLQKFFQENTLMNQAFVKDNKLTIAQYLTSVEKDLVATGFCRVTLG
jgi:elongation factor Ts